MTTVLIAPDLFMTLSEDGRHSFYAPGEYVGGKLGCEGPSAKDMSRDAVERLCEPVGAEAVAHMLTVPHVSPHIVPLMEYAPAPILSVVQGQAVLEVVTLTQEPTVDPVLPAPPAVPLPGAMGLLLVAMVGLWVRRMKLFYLI